MSTAKQLLIRGLERSDNLSYTLFSLLLLLFTISPGTRVRAQPNILFVLTDDQGIGDLSLHGNDSIRTPNMDALLQSGAKFNRFYVSPVCAPTRASFLSGKYHPRTGAVFVTRRMETMDDEVTTIAEHLGAAGYRTGLFGKWHNGATFPYHPGGQGFDEFLGFTLGHYNNYFDGELSDERGRTVSFSGSLTELLTERALDFMTKTNQPFFCMVTYQAPHTPVQVEDRFWNDVEARGLTDYNTGIYAMVESIDARIGRLLDALEAEGKLDNTIVVFSTDNGPNGDRYRMGLRGTKGHVDEGGVRVPFGIKLPAGHPANGKEFATPAAHIDLLPTVMDLIGEPVPAGLDGKSLVPVLEGGELAERYVYAFKQGPEYTGFPGSMRNERYLYVARAEDEHELYDLVSDPGQENNIYRKQRRLGKRMARTYRDFATTIGRPDLVAPPIALDAPGGGVIHLKAHEGEPMGETRFSDEYGWANDFFVDIDDAGGGWPVVSEGERSFRVRIYYHLDAAEALAITVSLDDQPLLQTELPPGRAERLAVDDRVKRKEVYPYDWRIVDLGEVTIPAGAEGTLRVHTAGRGDFWVKELRLEP